MRSFLVCFLLACNLLFFGCGRSYEQQQGELDGEVFIVTQGAENIKLGLVDVRILPYAETKAAISKTKARAAGQIALLQPKLQAAREALASAQEKQNSAYAKYAAEVNSESVDGSDAALARFYDAKEEVRHANGLIAAVEKQGGLWNSGLPYFADLPSPLASVKTDADGKFSIPIDRKATVVLAASATRRLLDKTENYYWLITVSLDGQQNKRIFLSNDNLATSDSNDSLVHVVE